MKFIKLIFISVNCFCLLINFSHANSLADILNLKVFTASKSQENLNRATSIVSVIGKDEIRKSGARTVYEVLKRVVGFFPTTQATWTLIGTRGIINNGSDHILFLVDGHSQNSILEQGFQQQDTMPNLEYVKKIEIIRGPGSVLWGSSAMMAIINIITIDGTSDEDKSVKISGGFGSADEMKNLNLIKGINGEDYKGFISFNAWESKGYNDPKSQNIKFPWGASSNIWPNIDRQYPSFDLYTKLKLSNKHVIKARLFDQSIVYPWDSWSYDGFNLRPGSKLRTRKAYIDYSFDKKYNENTTVTYNFYGDLHLQLRHPNDIYNPAGDTRWVEDMSREETAFGGEVSLKHETEKNKLTTGIKFVRSELGPNRTNRFDTSTNLPTTPTGSEEQVNVIGVRPGVDNSFSVYVQDKYSLNSQFDLFAGLRADNNDYRENELVFLPRGGLIYEFNNNWTVKYIVNTGYLRPNAVYSKTGGKFYRSPSKTIENVNVVDKSEKIVSQDFQIAKTSENLMLNFTFFKMNISDYISWETVTDLGYRQLGDVETIGVEVDGRYIYKNKNVFYGNFTFAKGKLEKVPTVTGLPASVPSDGGTKVLIGAVSDQAGRWLNYPKYIMNVGTDLEIFEKVNLNLNLRAWKDMRIMGDYQDSARRKLHGQAYLDTSILVQKINDLDLNFFVKNIFDNRNKIGLVINNGTYTPRGRNVGFKFSFNY